jgi:hypothetical protein
MQEQVCHRVGMLIVRHDLGENAARGIVDANRSFIETPEFFDVDEDAFTRCSRS